MNDMNLDDMNEHIMEVPYAHNLNWSFHRQPQQQQLSPTATSATPNVNSFDAGASTGAHSHAIHGGDMSTTQDANAHGQIQLTPEEIAAYMRLDPQGGTF